MYIRNDKSYTNDLFRLNLSSGQMKRVNIRLKEEFHTKAKVIAVLKDITLNEYFENAIAEAITRDKEILEKIKKKL